MILKTTENKMTLPMLTASVAGNMMGSGMFFLPTVLSSIGSISIFGWIVSMFGTCAFALVFSKLSRLIPKAGGPYAFTRRTYGTYLSFQTAFVYWIGAWIGNIAVAIVTIGYLSFFFPILKQPFYGCITGILMIWSFIILNMFGPRFMGRIQIFTTSLMLLPVLCVVIFGWFWFDKSIFLNAYNVADTSSFTAITQSASITLWAFLGIETASVNAGIVKNPEKTIPIATILGVLIAGTIYILSSSILMGIIPHAQLAASSSPFSLLATMALGPTAGAVVSLCAIIACFGALAGWTMVMGQISKAASDDKIFPRIFSFINRYNAPYFGLICSGILITIVYTMTLSPTISEHFSIISAITVFMIVLTYLYSSASLFIILKEQSQKKNKLFLLASMIACIYSMWAIIGLGKTTVYFGGLTLLFTVLFYTYPVLKKSI